MPRGREEKKREERHEPNLSDQSGSTVQEGPFARRQTAGNRKKKKKKKEKKNKPKREESWFGDGHVPKEKKKEKKGVEKPQKADSQ